VQPGAPPGQFSRWVNGHGAITIPADGDHSKQFDGQLSLPAANARPHRSIRASMRRSRILALDHS
jgi:hypothetical protein